MKFITFKLSFLIILIFFLNNKYVFSDELKSKTRYLIGKAYKIKGVWYYPKENYLYKEVGIPSTYSKRIKSKYTKNGELYSKELVSAAHRTLPLPSIVNIKNLQNGISINVRVNDRGPNNNFRIIQLSLKAAEILKIKDYGLVEVKILPKQSRLEYDKLNKKNSSISDENLEKIDDLSKPAVQIENLIDKKKIIKKKKQKKNLDKSLEVKDKLNFKQNLVEPFHLRIHIATFNNFKDAANLRSKLRKIYAKVLLSLKTIDNHNFYSIKTVPIKNIKEAERILSIIQKKGYKNAKIIIEEKRYD